MKNSIKEYIKSKPYIHKKIMPIKVFLLKELPMLIKYRKLELREYMIFPEKQLVYLSNSKAAGSSIKKTFVEEEVLDDYSVHNKVEHNKRNKLNEEEKKYFKFSFVRNPYSRLVSCYKSKYYRDKELGYKILRFDYYLLGYLQKDKGFKNFVKRVSRIPNNLANRHFDSQFKLLYDKKGNCLVDYIGKFEKLEEDFKYIKNKYKLYDLPHFNKTEKTNWMDYYTIETANIVRKKYSKEIEHFDYENDYTNLINYIKNKNKGKSIINEE